MRNFTPPLLLLLTLLFTFNLSAQVYTRILGPGEQIVDHIPWHINEKPAPVLHLAPDVDAVLADDAANNPTNRVAIERKTNYGIEDGTFYTFGNYAIWKLTVSSPDATYLSFALNDLDLPPGSQLIAYSDDYPTVHGPVTSQSFRNGTYVTETVAGDEVTMEVFLPDNTIENFQLNLDALYYGIARTMGGPVEKAYGDALVCTPDIECSEGDSWQLESDAVCAILQNFTADHCTGTLISDECRTGTPFILTANHCVDDAGEDPSTLRFRFNYKNIVCGGTTQPWAGLYITFDGAVTRAEFADADMALLELQDDISSEFELAFAGWNNTTVSPSDLTTIHHPQSDAMKISYDGDQPTVTTSDESLAFGTINVRAGDGFTHTAADNNGIDYGVVEVGSSGAGSFNSNHQIVATIVGSQSNNCNPTPVIQGRFSSAWNSGGPTSSSLASWLSLDGSAQSVNGHHATVVKGSEVVCVNDVYELLNFLPGSSISWTVTPTSLFSGNTSGAGSIAQLSRQNSQSSGAATISFTIDHPDCGISTFERDLWVGLPAIPTISLPACFEPNLNYWISASSAGSTSLTWQLPNCPFLPFDPQRCWENYTGNLPSVFVHSGEQEGSISVFASNRCGSRSVNREIEFCDDGGGGGGGPIIKSLTENAGGGTEPIEFSAFPNPIKEGNNLRLEFEGSAALKLSPPVVSVFDITGRILLESLALGGETTMTINLSPGVYLLSVSTGSQRAIKKIMVQ